MPHTTDKFVPTLEQLEDAAYRSIQNRVLAQAKSKPDPKVVRVAAKLMAMKAQKSLP